MRDTLIGAVALLAVLGTAVEAGAPRRQGTAPCGVRMWVPPGWTAVAEAGFRESCEVELRPPEWRRDSECPERYGGRLFVMIVPKQLQNGAPLRQQEWLRVEPACDSGWSAIGEMGSCLSRIKGRAAALTTEANFRLYCNGTYAAQETGNFGVVFGEKRLAFITADAGDPELFGQVVASLRP